MEQHPVRITAGERNDTIYIVEYATGSSARESAYEKVKRLILEDTKSYLVKSGESFYLKGLKRHHIEAYGVKEAVFIWVSTPPNF